MNTNRAEVAKTAAEELRTTVELATRALGDMEQLAILDPHLGINEKGMAKVFDTLQKFGDIAAGRKFDLAVVTDLSYSRQSRDKK